jgi:hypothetical protein
MQSRFRLLPIMFILIFALLVGMPIAAQDLVTNTPVAEVEATINGTPVEATLIAPVETPAPVVVEQPSVSSQLIDKLFDVVLLFAVVFLAFKQSNLIPPSVLDSVMEKLFGYAKGVATQIPGDADDRLLAITEEVIRRWVREEQAKLPPPTASAN